MRSVVGLVGAMVLLLSGSAGALADYRLPYPAGERRQTMQGNNDRSASHQGKLAFAFDFDGRIGDRVVAMRSGSVLKVNTSTSGTAPWAGRYVVVDHGDDTVALYAHLNAVTVGTTVAQGGAIGLVGNSGFVLAAPGADGSHVHVQIMSTTEYNALEALREHAGLNAQSQRFVFADPDVQRDGGTPRTGQSYTSANAGTPAPQHALYDDFQAPSINSTRWSPAAAVQTSALIRAIQNGKLVLKNLMPLSGILENGVFMTQFVGLLRAIQVDVRLTEFEPPPPGAVNTNRARLLLALYNDGTPGGGFAGDVTADISIGVRPGSSTPDIFFQVFRCADPSCGPASTFLTGTLGPLTQPGSTHDLVILWDGATIVRFVFNGTLARALDISSLGPIVGPPVAARSGLSVVGVSRAAAEFDNVIIERQ